MAVRHFGGRVTTVLSEIDPTAAVLPADGRLRAGIHGGHLVAASLKRHWDVPVLYIGGISMTGREMAAEVSRYVQAFEALGAGTGSAVALLALNRPEVLLITAAGQLQGQRRTALHPLGSLEDHAYMLADAGITTLVIDPSPVLVERALALVEKMAESLPLTGLGKLDKKALRAQYATTLGAGEP
jgi:fatty-acyl-CoA synthase